MKYIAFVITALLFVGPVLLAQIGWPVEGDIKGSLKCYPSFYILLVFVMFYFFYKPVRDRYCIFALTIIVVSITYFLIPRFFGGVKYSNMVLLNSMALPAMYYFFWSNTSYKYKKDVQNILLMLFVFNSLMAIYERTANTLFFPVDLIRSDFSMSDVYERSIFRSTALLGHPLSNALIMSIIMVFVLLSDLKPSKKYSLYCIGLISVFCFNARAAIIVDILLLVLYFARQLYSRKIFAKRKILTILIAFSSVFLLQLLFDSGLAGRFAERGGFSSDESALQRVYVWMIFQKYDINYFLWGLPGDVIQKITYLTYGTRYVENWFVAAALMVGLVVTILVVLLFIPLFMRAMKPYSRYNSFLLLLACLGIASSNNSLACGVPAIATFFTCCYAFSTEESKRNMLIVFRKKNRV